MATGGATPRKFAEKIAMHNQKGAEENAEFQKIMSEIARVKGNAAMPSPRPPPTLTNPLMLVGGPRIHLSPNFPSAVPRHGSLPNVAAQLQQQNIQNAPAGGTGGVTLNNGGAVNPMFASMETTGPMMNQSSPMAILNPNPHQHHGHGSLRDSMVGSAGGSATQIHNIRGSSGPIRSHKHRKDTSPYGSERLSSTGMGQASASHLSPPDNSGAWRRVRSDPFLHHNSIHGSSTGVSPTGSISDTPNAILGSNGAISPLQGASPTMPRRVPPPSAASSYNSNSQLPTIVNNVQNTKNNYQLGLPMPETCGAELKPGSLPNLTNLEIGHSNNHPLHGLNQDSSQSNCGPGGGPAQNSEESPISSTSPQWSSQGGSPNSPHHRTNEMSPSMSATSGGSSSYVRLSDNEISKILSIPVSLVSESSQEAVSCAETQAKTNLVSSATASVCDNTSRNLLHLNKGIAVDQSSAQQNDIMYGTNMQIKTEDGQNMVDMTNMSNYRNPQSIQPPPSPVMQGSPLGRSASPIDLAGSPHSPSTLGGNGPNQPVNYPDAMALAGQNYQHFMDLTNEVQKMTVLENPNEQGMYISTTSGFQTQQPINEFVEFINNQQQLDSKNNYHETNPQTPSSIPEIILTGADDGSDQALQRMLGINNDNLDCFLDGDLKEGLGKLDDNMMRLLSSDNGTMDQLADPATEEHLKKV